MKRAVSILLVLCMALSVFGITSFAAETEPAPEEVFEGADYNGVVKTELGNGIESLLKPQVILTFKSGPTDITTIPIVKGEGKVTIHVPKTFCLKRNVMEVDNWKPVDPISFNGAKIKAGTDITLDYESARELFGIHFIWTVVKMVGC